MEQDTFIARLRGWLGSLANAYSAASKPSDFLDAFIWLEPDNPNFVLRWRVEAEERSKAAGKAGMTAEEIGSFVARFLLAYKTYLPGLRQRRQMGRPLLHFMMDSDRQTYES